MIRLEIEVENIDELNRIIQAVKGAVAQPGPDPCGSHCAAEAPVGGDIPPPAPTYAETNGTSIARARRAYKPKGLVAKP